MSIAPPFFQVRIAKICLRPLYASRVQAGFPSPADDYVEKNLDLNEHLIHHPEATFFVRATGDSMIGAGIYPNSILIVDKSLTPTSGNIVIAIVNGEFTVKRLIKSDSQCILHSANPRYQPIIIKDENQLLIWGVVTAVIQELG